MKAGYTEHLMILLPLRKPVKGMEVIRMNYSLKPGRLLFTLLILFTACMLSSCAESGKKHQLAFADVALASEPGSPLAKQNTKLTVTVNNENYAKQEAVVQLQINSKNSLPKLIDTIREGDSYTAQYEFPTADNYTITVHLSYEEDHFSFAKTLKVNE